MKIYMRHGAASLLALLPIVTTTQACETCAVYAGPNVPASAQNESYTYQLNWFTRYARLDQRLDGSAREDRHGESIESLIHQLSYSYQPSPSLRFQTTIPLLRRDMRRHTDQGLRSDHEAGAGDMSLLASYRIPMRRDTSGYAALTLVGGIKIPTGDSDRLSQHGHHDRHAHAGPPHHHTHNDHRFQSAISEHNVALGSGSWDWITGLRFDGAWGAWSADGGVLAYWRTEGDFDYEFADDLYVSAHVGRDLLRKDGNALNVRAGVQGEFRDADRRGGRSIDHTMLDAWYADAACSFTYASWLGEVGVEQALHQKSGGATLVPEQRFRFSIGIRL